MSDHVVIVTARLPRTIPALIALANGAVAGLGDPDNAHWFATPAPTPALALVTTAIGALQQAEVVANTRARGAASARNAKKTALRKLLVALVAYVQSIVDTNPPSEAQAIIDASGFSVRAKGTHPVPVLDVSPGAQPGTANFRAKAGPKGKRIWYDNRYSIDGGHTWVQGTGSNYAATLITGLPSLTSVAFQVRLTIGKVVGTWSQTVTCIIH